MRFHPPPTPIGPDLRWLLLAAFGSGPIRIAPDGEAVLSLAVALDLSGRLGGRHPEPALREAVGARVCARLKADHREAVARALHLTEIGRRVALEAGAAGIPCAALKLLALRLSETTPLGWRHAADVDLLASGRDVPRLEARLLAAGFRPSGLPGFEHQRPPLLHPSGTLLEIHLTIPGVRPDGRKSATLDELTTRGLVAPGPDGLLLPSPPIAAAHAIVHGIAQNGFAPGAYPLMRMVADLVDLVATPELEATIVPLVARDVSAEEVAGALELARLLATGELPRDGEPAATLLLHVLLGATDTGYAASLGLSRFAVGPTDRPRLVAAMALVWRALAPTSVELDQIYGPPRSRFDRARRRLLRPVDLLRRASRALTATLSRSGREGSDRKAEERGD